MFELTAEESSMLTAAFGDITKRVRNYDEDEHFLVALFTSKETSAKKKEENNDD